MTRDEFDALFPVLDSFEDRLEEGKTLCVRAPGRTELAGNHTDHEGGHVIAAALDRDVFGTFRANGQMMARIKSEGYDPIDVDLTSLEPRDVEKGTTAALVRGLAACMAEQGYEVSGFDAAIRSDVPAGSGLSSSAAFEVLMARAMSGLWANGELSRERMALMSQRAEREWFGKPCGLMDQMACSVGNLVHIDFGDTGNPAVDKVDFDFSKTDYVLCITDTKGSHADLTNEYAAVPLEMKKIASLLGYDVLRPVSFEDIIENIGMLREKAGDRAVLRAIHFVNETLRAQDEAEALKSGDLKEFLSLVKQSGDSSFKYLQNVYTNNDVTVQNVSLALAISDTVLTSEEVSRVHGGGFAGTIQAFVKKGNAKRYKKYMDKVFGDGSCEILAVRKYGGIRVI